MLGVLLFWVFMAHERKEIRGKEKILKLAKAKNKMGGRPSEDSGVQNRGDWGLVPQVKRRCKWRVNLQIIPRMGKPESRGPTMGQTL